MGNFWSRFPWTKKRYAVVMIGLDGAGKTSIVNRLKQPKLKELPQTMPSRAFNLVTLEFPFADITFWEFGGDEKVRPVWHEFYWNAHGFIFVVDATDGSRLLEARNELDKVVNGRNIKTYPLLVLCNKADSVDAAPTEFIEEALGMETVGHPKCKVMRVSALTGEGLDEALRWMTDNLSRSFIASEDKLKRKLRERK